MRPSTWADRLLALLVRFVGLVILLATLAAATASFLYNQSDEEDRAARVATQFNMRLRDHVAILEGVRALYQSDAAASGPGNRAHLVEPTPAMEHQVATGGDRAGRFFSRRPGQRLHVDIVGHQQSVKADAAPDGLRDDRRREGGAG